MAKVDDEVARTVVELAGTRTHLCVALRKDAPYAEFSKVRGEVFLDTPPTSTAVQVAGLLLGARIEIDAVAFIAKR